MALREFSGELDVAPIKVDQGVKAFDGKLDGEPDTVMDAVKGTVSNLAATLGITKPSLVERTGGAGTPSKEASIALGNVLPSVANDRAGEAAANDAATEVPGAPVRQDYFNDQAVRMSAQPKDIASKLAAQHGITGRINKAAVEKTVSPLSPAVKITMDKALDGQDDEVRTTAYTAAGLDANKPDQPDAVELPKSDRSARISTKADEITASSAGLDRHEALTLAKKAVIQEDLASAQEVSLENLRARLDPDKYMNERPMIGRRQSNLTRKEMGQAQTEGANMGFDSDSAVGTGIDLFLTRMGSGVGEAFSKVAGVVSPQIGMWAGKAAERQSIAGLAIAQSFKSGLAAKQFDQVSKDELLDWSTIQVASNIGNIAAYASEKAVAPYLGVIGVQTFGDALRQGEEGGLKASVNYTQAIGKAVAEVGVELIPFELADKFKGAALTASFKQQFVKRIAAYGGMGIAIPAAEGGEEILTNLFDNIIDRVVADQTSTPRDTAAKLSQGSITDGSMNAFAAGAIGGGPGAAVAIPSTVLADKAQTRSYNAIKLLLNTDSHTSLDDNQLTQMRLSASAINDEAPDALDTKKIDDEIERRALHDITHDNTEPAAVKSKPENIDAADILGEENVSTTGTPAAVAAASPELKTDQPAGSSGDSLLLPDNADDTGGKDDATAPAAGSERDLPAGADNAPDNPLDTGAHIAATSPINDTPEPTDAQKEAGNYKVGRANIAGLDISIENPEGSTRSGTSKSGKEWSNTMSAHYGYIKGVPARAPDKEHVDVFVKPGTPEQFAGNVFVVNQNHPDGTFDEPKVMMGFASQKEAEVSYMSHYDKSWKGMGSIAEVDMPRFKEMLQGKNSFMKPIEDEKVSQEKSKDTLNPESTIQAIPETTAAVKSDPEVGAQQAAQPNATRPIVESMVKRRAAAAQIHMEKTFDLALAAAKDLMNGKPVKATRFKNWSGQFKRDQKLSDIMTELFDAASFTPESIAAKQKKSDEAKERAAILQRVDLAKDDVLTAMAKLGGLNKDEAKRLYGLDDAGMKQHGSGILRSFTSKGKTPDVMRMKLEELGFPVGADLAEFGEVVESAMRGEEVLAAEGQEATFNAKMEEYNSGYEELSDDEQNALDEAITKATELYGADAVAMIDSALATSMEGQPTAVIERELLRTLNEQIEEDAGVDAVGANAEDKGNAKGPSGQSSGADGQETRLELAGQTSEELKAAEKAKADQRKADEDARKRAEADSKVNDFTLTGSDSEADKAAARGAQDLFGKSQPVSQPTKSNTEDSGAELTHNKRNRLNRGLTWEDIQDKNATLRVSEVIKSKVAPRPDFEALIKDGMEPMIAHIVKQVYDSISNNPQVRAAPTDSDLQLYIRSVNRIMDGLMKWATDPAATAKWTATQSRDAIRISELSAASSLMDVIYPDSWRARRDEVIIAGGNRVLGSIQPGRDMKERAAKAVQQGWPSKQESWQKQGWTIATPENYTIKDKTIYINGRYSHSLPTEQEAKAEVAAYKPFLLVSKGRAIKGQFDTEDEALEAARAAVKREKSDKISDKGISVEMAQREGVAHRLEGEDVSSDKVKEAFGFKGINFGTWMKGDTPSKLAERQLHLNHTYDSFMDLADILGIPPKAMSLNGMLGLAIGAQGNGSAAAHFVAGVNEINLTRTSGAGSLAHEWGHAVDHYFGVQAGLATLDRPFLTEHARNNSMASEIRPEIIGRFAAIVRAMNTKEYTKTVAEFEEEHKKYTERRKRDVDYRLIPIKRDFMSAKVDEAKFDKIAEKIRNLDMGDGREEIGRNRSGHIDSLQPAVAELRDLYKKITGRIYSVKSIKELQASVDLYAYAIESDNSANHVPQQLKKDTDYSNAAAALDKGKSKPYWSTNLEKFARAFDSYVSDKIEAKAGMNSYLSHTGR